MIPDLKAKTARGASWQIEVKICWVSYLKKDVQFFKKRRG
jgi:hypothetical protein